MDFSVYRNASQVTKSVISATRKSCIWFVCAEIHTHSCPFNCLQFLCHNSHRQPPNQVTYLWWQISFPSVLPRFMRTSVFYILQSIFFAVTSYVIRIFYDAVCNYFTLSQFTDEKLNTCWTRGIEVTSFKILSRLSLWKTPRWNTPALSSGRGAVYCQVFVRRSLRALSYTLNNKICVTSHSNKELRKCVVMEFCCSIAKPSWLSCFLKPCRSNTVCGPACVTLR
jgi:hypothetical protein